MALRWYSAVVDCADITAQAHWWAEALGWKVVHEAADEVAIVPAHVGEATVGATPWEEIGPGLVFVPVAQGKTVKNRIHIDLAPHTGDDRGAEIARLTAMGATRVDVGQGADVTWDVLADPEGNEFCVLSSRDS